MFVLSRFLPSELNWVLIITVSYILDQVGTWQAIKSFINIYKGPTLFFESYNNIIFSCSVSYFCHYLKVGLFNILESYRTYSFGFFVEIFSNKVSKGTEITYCIKRPVMFSQVVDLGESKNLLGSLIMVVTNRRHM